MECELCHAQHDGTYGSGRFCSQKCARSFTTHKNRAEISKRVSETLSRSSRDYKVDLVKLRDQLTKVTSWSALAREFDLGGNGSRVQILTREIVRAGLDPKHATSHFKRPRTLDEILSVRPGEHKGHLRNALIKSGRKYACEECGQGSTWNEKKLVLQVDHKNGNSHDHRPENLRFLCPNCHTQTDTYAWKNVRRKRKHES